MKAAHAVFLLMLASCNFNCYKLPEDNKPVDPNKPPPTDTNVQYAEVATFLTATCVKCHSAGSPSGGQSFDSYEGVMKAVKAGDAAESVLCYVVRNGLMPPRGPAPTGDQVDMVCGWIQQGAKK